MIHIFGRFSCQLLQDLINSMCSEMHSVDDNTADVSSPEVELILIISSSDSKF